MRLFLGVFFFGCGHAFQESISVWNVEDSSLDASSSLSSTSSLSQSIQMPDAPPMRDLEWYTSDASSTNSSGLYVDLNDRVNPYWADLKANLTIGTNSYGPALGSTIAVNHALIDNNPLDTSHIASRPIPSNMIIHTPTSTYIGRRYFDRQSRWYQEDNNTQIFRMFPGDDNVASSRTMAPRVEAFNNVSWKRGDGWYEFSARYTFLSLRSSTVFQIKHNTQYWSMQLVVSSNKSDGTWNLNYKKLNNTAAGRVIQTDILNKSFDIRVLDDGTYHRVYINNELRVQGNMTARLDSEQNKARWGFYSPGSAMDREILMFVTGVYVGPYRTLMPTTAPTIAPTVAPSDVPSNRPSMDWPTAARVCVGKIRKTCSMKRYYLGNMCWSNIIDTQCQGLESRKRQVARSLEKAAFHRCFRVVKQQCNCGHDQYLCSLRVGRQICGFPGHTTDKGAALFDALWDKLDKKCGVFKK